MNDEDFDIPDHIINPQDSKANDEKEALYKRLAKRSSFLFTLNPNFSSAVINTPARRRGLSLRLLKLNKEMEMAFANGRMLKPSGRTNPVNFTAPQLISYETNLEIGGKLKMIHTHSTIHFDGPCLLDFKAIREHIRTSANGFPDRKVHIDIKKFQARPEEVLLAYVRKAKVIDEQGQPPPKPVFKKPTIKTGAPSTLP